MSREGRWFRYQPWVRGVTMDHPGRSSAKHLITAETEGRYEFACGSSVHYHSIYAERVEDAPRADLVDWRLRWYCSRCLRTVGLRRPRNNLRDTQRSKVYAAERMARSACRVSGRAMTMATVEEAQAYVDTVMEEGWCRALFPDVGDPVTVRGRKGNGRTVGHADAQEIALTPRGLTEFTVVHELAHTIHKRLKDTEGRPWYLNDPTRDHSGHGAVWAGIHLALVDECMGPDVGELHRQAYRGRGVKWEEWDPKAAGVTL